MLRLTTRGIKTAEAIRDRVEFTTSGSLKAGRLRYYDTGYLNDNERDQFTLDYDFIDYVVYSYGTPIAWHGVNGWHIVAQKFSPTTTKHQGNLYLIDANPVHPASAGRS